jgi:hypothetical protein
MVFVTFASKEEHGLDEDLAVEISDPVNFGS